MWKAAEVSLPPNGHVAEVDYLGIMEDILHWFVGDTHHSSGKPQRGDLRSISKTW